MFIDDSGGTVFYALGYLDPMNPFVCDLSLAVPVNCRTLGVSSRHSVCDACSGAPFREAMMALAGVSDRSYGGIFSQLFVTVFQAR